MFAGREIGVQSNSAVDCLDTQTRARAVSSDRCHKCRAITSEFASVTGDTYFFALSMTSTRVHVA